MKLPKYKSGKQVWIYVIDTDGSIITFRAVVNYSYSKLKSNFTITYALQRYAGHYPTEWLCDESIVFETKKLCEEYVDERFLDGTEPIETP